MFGAYVINKKRVAVPPPTPKLVPQHFLGKRSISPFDLSDDDIQPIDQKKIRLNANCPLRMWGMNPSQGPLLNNMIMNKHIHR